MGSAGVKVISVVRDVTDAYVHAGGPVRVGLGRARGRRPGRRAVHARVDGSELRYNQDDVYLPDLVVCRPELSEPILTYLAEHGVE